MYLNVFTKLTKNPFFSCCALSILLLLVTNNEKIPQFKKKKKKKKKFLHIHRDKIGIDLIDGGWNITMKRNIWLRNFN